MEADEYFSTYDALHEEGTSPHQLPIRVRDSCGINKVVWSSFDFMTGPELRFVWEVGCSTSVSPVNLSGEEGSVNDAESLDSSMSARSGQYEDIDDPLQADLTSTADMVDSLLLSDSAYHFFTSSPIGGYDGGTYLDDYMTESRSTTTLTCSTSTVHNESSSLDLSRSDLLSPRNGQVFVPRSDEGSSGDTTQVSPTDLMCGTPIEGINVSQLLTTDQSRNEECTRATSQCSVSATVTAESSFAKICQEEDMINTASLADELRRLTKTSTPNPNNEALTTSCVDSGIAGTISTHSDLSALCQSPITANRSTFNGLKRLDSGSPGSPDSADFTSLLDLPLDAPEDSITDEHFVAKFILAEQICSTQLPSNPLMHKLTVVPFRRLLVGSFIFSAESRKGRKSLNAISFLMSNGRSNWFMTRQTLFDTYIMDVVPRLKASIYSEDFDDVIVRLTADITRLLNLMGSLDRFPIVSFVRPLMVKNSLLCVRRCVEDRVLGRAISGILQSQGYCVVIGSDHLYISRLLTTLAMFMPDEWKWCCIRPYRHKYDPHIRLQAVRRSELPLVVQFGVTSSWPICIVDVDRSTVCMSAPYSRHRVLRQRFEVDKVQAILAHASLCAEKRKNIKLELSSCRVLEPVKSLLSRMDVLPLEESARLGFVSQFLLYLENTALALIAYVKEASLPLPSEKASPLKSSHFSLSDCRRALDLTSDSWFHAVLAKADMLQPDFAEFICL